MAKPRFLLLAALSLLAAGCGGKPQYHTDVVVVGAGIAGLAAALEAADNGANVIVVDMNSVGGGHAVKAGGLAMVNTQLQRDKGIADDAATATADMLAWGETADAGRVKKYAEESGEQVYDWLTGLGVEFRLILPTPESDIPRFHFTRGTAVHVVLPMMRAALRRPGIRFIWSSAAEQLLLSDSGATYGAAFKNLRTGARFEIYAPAIVLATGGYQSNIKTVQKNWPDNRPTPPTVLVGSGEHATGSGYELAALANAQLQRMEQQVTFVNGIPDPRIAGRGLTLENRYGILVNNKGLRFVDEQAPTKTKELAVFDEAIEGHWLITDSKTLKKTIVRGAAWLTPELIRSDILSNPDIVVSADTLSALAVAADLPPAAFRNSVSTFNQQAKRPISTPPYHAIRLYPLTRKSLGGPATDHNGGVLNTNNETIAGLFAAGELTGVGGINGSYGGSGTFLGPSVWQGRIAGRAAATLAETRRPEPLPEKLQRSEKVPAEADGYWHYKTAHELINERGTNCETCHNLTPMSEIGTNADMLVRLNTCTQCH